jgi:glucose-6-phosphate dehydrogenase assembly protein OpcA
MVDHFRMKRILLALLLPATLMVMSFSGAQTPDADQEQRLLALIKEVQTQQTQMADNQKKIETKLADIGETVRVARIFAGRSQ